MYLECLSVEEQFRAIRSATTLVGAHGAGLAWSTLTEKQVAEIQVVGFPCRFESHSTMKFRGRYGIVPSLGSMVHSSFANATAKAEWCLLLPKLEKQNRKRAKLLTDSDRELLRETGVPTDVRKLDVVVDIPFLIDTVSSLDITLSPVPSAGHSGQAGSLH